MKKKTSRVRLPNSHRVHNAEVFVETLDRHIREIRDDAVRLGFPFPRTGLQHYVHFPADLLPQTDMAVKNMEFIVDALDRAMHDGLLEDLKDALRVLKEWQEVAAIVEGEETK